MSSLLASIIIPTYNYGHYISEAIDSILESDFPKDQLEILVVDDGSTDQTEETIKCYGKKIRYFYQKNMGKAHATQVGINLSQGKYIFNLDADDWFLPQKIREVVQIFEFDQELVHVAHPALLWHQNDNFKTIEPVPRHLLGHKVEGEKLLSYFYERRILFGGGSTFAARASILKNCSIPKAVDIFIDEYLILYTLMQGYSYFIEEPLSAWRIHGKNFSNLQTDLSLYHAKMARSLSSMEAVLDCVVQGNFGSNLQKIYKLKVKIAILAAREKSGEKTFSDVVDLWKLLLKSFNPLSPVFLRLVKAYTILNRSLPTPIITFAANIKRRIIHFPFFCL